MTPDGVPVENGHITWSAFSWSYPVRMGKQTGTAKHYLRKAAVAWLTCFALTAAVLLVVSLVFTSIPLGMIIFTDIAISTFLSAAVVGRDLLSSLGILEKKPTKPEVAWQRRALQRDALLSKDELTVDDILNAPRHQGEGRPGS